MDKKSLKCSERWHQQLHDNWETRPIILMLMLVQLLSGLAQNIFYHLKSKWLYFMLDRNLHSGFTTGSFWAENASTVSNREYLLFQVDAPRERERDCMTGLIKNMCCSPLLQRKLPSSIPHPGFLLLIRRRDALILSDLNTATNGTLQSMEPLFFNH